MLATSSVGIHDDLPSPDGTPFLHGEVEIIIIDRYLCMKFSQVETTDHFYNGGGKDCQEVVEHGAFFMFGKFCRKYMEKIKNFSPED